MLPGDNPDDDPPPPPFVGHAYTDFKIRFYIKKKQNKTFGHCWSDIFYSQMPNSSENQRRYK